MRKSLKIVCLVKVVPDVEEFAYDYEKNVLVRENIKSIVNPADACAIAAALKVRDRYNAEVIVISMGPKSIQRHLENLIRTGADRAILITDDLYRGSDTYATGKIIGRCIKECGFDLIFTGTHSIDGDTAHIPCQIAEFLDVNIMSNITKIMEEELSNRQIQFEVKNEEQTLRFAMKWPAVLGISSESKYKLPFIKYDDLKKEVSDRISIVTNEKLGFHRTEVGLEGSKTRVIHTYPKQFVRKNKVVVSNDENGIEYIYQFLKEKGFV